ncbi:MAG: V4R domain-containing protein [Oscillospiraceae bacterium]
MLHLFESGDENRFTWEGIGDIDEGRRNLGAEMPVFVYRLLQFTLKDELIKRYGSEVAIDLFRSAGKLAGVELSNHMLDLTLPLNSFLAQLKEVLEKTKIGILRIEKFEADTGRAVLTVGEDLDCSGMPITGETVCNYDEGFLAGILETYTKREYVVTEVDCWATGARVCRFEAHIKASE